MKRFILVCYTLLITIAINAQELLYECGQNSGTNFNGWYISPAHVFDAIEFDAQSTTFFSEGGGNYSMTLTRQIDAISTYDDLSILFNFESLAHCKLEHVVYYTSTNGEQWDAINESENNTAVYIKNSDLSIKYIRATATATFYRNGKIACNYVKVEGTRKKMTPELKEVAIDDSIFEQNFFIFSFEHTLNIETQIETPYEVLITSINGQIVYREALEGSNRIELPADLKGMFIITVIHENAFKASKKVVV